MELRKFEVVITTKEKFNSLTNILQKKIIEIVKEDFEVEAAINDSLYEMFVHTSFIALMSCMAETRPWDILSVDVKESEVE